MRIAGLPFPPPRHIADHTDQPGAEEDEADWLGDSLGLNRKPGFQPLPAALVERLAEEAAGKTPDDPLLFVTKYPAGAIKRDLKLAGIPRWTPEGKVDFHACRTAYVTLVLETGCSVKEAQSLARHATPNLTMNTYGRSRQNRLAELAEAVGNKVIPGPD